MPFNYATHDDFPYVILGHSQIFPLSPLTKVGITLQNHDIWTSIFIKRRDFDLLRKAGALWERSTESPRRLLVSFAKWWGLSNFKRLIKLKWHWEIPATSPSYLSTNDISSLKCRIDCCSPFAANRSWMLDAVLSVESLNHCFGLAGKNCNFQSLSFHCIELNNSISWLTDEFQAFLCLGWTWDHFSMPFNNATHDNFPYVILGHLDIFPLSSLTNVGSTLRNQDILDFYFYQALGLGLA